MRKGWIEEVEIPYLVERIEEYEGRKTRITGV
jgi:hypothetical protein